VALAAIASPERFRASLVQAGWQVARLIAFRDHHAYTRRDVVRVGAALEEAAARVVLTTEKDAVRLLPLRPLPFPVAAVPLGIVVRPEEHFRAWLFGRLSEARS
jgi:tetraacyldisaccharide 4'-kinase